MVTIKNGKLTVEIAEKGAEIQSAKDENGRVLTWNGDPKFWKGRGPVLFPICGRLLNNTYKYGGKEYELGSHGFAKLMVFDVAKKTDSSVTFLLKANEETYKMYPFNFEFYVSYTLEDKNIVVEYDVKNVDSKEMLFSVGGHEGYMLEGGIENYYIEFDKNVTLDSYTVVGPIINHETTRILENGNKLPLKNSYFVPDALVFKNIEFDNLTIKRNDGTYMVNVDFKGFPHLLLWTVPNAPYLCVEPWYGIPDSTDTDQVFETKEAINKLAAGDTFKAVHTLKF